MTKKLTEETTFTATVTDSGTDGGSSRSISTNDLEELKRFLELSGVKSKQTDYVSAPVPSCGEGWSDDNPVNMDAAGFETGGNTFDVDMRCEEVDTTQAAHDYGHAHSKANAYNMDTFDYKGRSESSGMGNFRRVNNYGDNPIRTNEDAEYAPVLSPDTVEKMPSDFIGAVYNRFGETVSSQIEELMKGASLNDASEGALKIVSQYARDIGYFEFWEDVSEYLENIGVDLPLESIDLSRLQHLSGIREANYEADPHGGSMISPYDNELSDDKIAELYDNVKGEVHHILDTQYDDVLYDYAAFLRAYDREDIDGLSSDIASDAIDQASSKYGVGDEYTTNVEMKDVQKYVADLIKSKLGINESRHSRRHFDNEKEEKYLTRIERKRKQGDWEKFTPRVRTEPEDKYAKMAREFGVEEDVDLEEREMSINVPYTEPSKKQHGKQLSDAERESLKKQASEIMRSPEYKARNPEVMKQWRRITDMLAVAESSDMVGTDPVVVVGQYVKINPDVGGGYGKVVDMSPSGKFAVVEIVGEGEYDIDDEAGMPDLTGERMSFHLSDLTPLESYDAMVDMIDRERGFSEGRRAAGYDNPQEIKTLSHIQRKRERADWEKFTPRARTEPEDKYAKMARELGVEEGVDLEEKLTEEYNNFLNEFGSRDPMESLAVHPMSKELLSAAEEAIRWVGDKNTAFLSVARDYAKKVGQPVETVVKFLNKHLGDMSRVDIMRSQKGRD